MASKFRKSEVFGSPGAAAALKAARIRAGFSSAAAAALAHGWSENTMRGHESGTRRISPADANKYAVAFGVEAGQLQHEGANVRERTQQLAELEQSKIVAAHRAREQKGEVAARLRFARTVRGFPTLSAASHYLGLNRATAGMHENGINAISERMGEAYSFAYGIEISWLLRGLFPSGLGSEVDRKIAHVGDNERLLSLAVECQALVEKSSVASADSIQQQFESALAKPSTVRDVGDEMHEADQHGNFPSDRGEGRSWILPSGLMSKLIGSTPAEVAVIAIDRPQAGWVVGDRVFVDTTKRDVTAGGYFSFSSDYGIRIEHFAPGGPIASPVSSDALLGKVVATFAWHDAHFSEPRRFGKPRY